MSNVNGINGSSGIYGMQGLGDTSGMSPDALLEYCQMQMSSLDSQITGLEQTMQQQTTDEKTVKNLQAQLEQMGGANGPQDAQGLHQAYEAYQAAINSLPDGDPVKAQLQDQCTAMCNQYGYTPPTTALTPDEQKRLTSDNKILQNGDVMKMGAAAFDKALLDDKQYGTADGNKKPDSNSWQGTTAAVGGLSDSINQDCQMQMLQLQQLASQQSNALELTTQLLQKVDSTALDIAKNT